MTEQEFLLNCQLKHISVTYHPSFTLVLSKKELFDEYKYLCSLFEPLKDTVTVTVNSDFDYSLKKFDVMLKINFYNVMKLNPFTDYNNNSLNNVKCIIHEYFYPSLKINDVYFICQYSPNEIMNFKGT